MKNSHKTKTAHELTRKKTCPQITQINTGFFLNFKLPPDPRLPTPALLLRSFEFVLYFALLASCFLFHQCKSVKSVDKNI